MSRYQRDITTVGAQLDQALRLSKLLDQLRAITEGDQAPSQLTRSLIRAQGAHERLTTALARLHQLEVQAAETGDLSALAHLLVPPGAGSELSSTLS